MANIVLEDLKEIKTELSDSQCDFFSENGIVALENNKHLSGCTLNVIGSTAAKFVLKWNKTFNRAGYKENTKIIEHAAEAISFFLTRQFTEYTVVEESPIGTGIDYWLGYEKTHKNYNPRNFMQARLEISGINKENPANTIEKRIKEKQIQSVKSQKTKLPAYISIVEFSNPKAFFGKK